MRKDHRTDGVWRVVFAARKEGTQMTHSATARLTPDQAVQRYFEVVRASSPSPRLRAALDKVEAESRDTQATRATRKPGRTKRR